MAVENDIDRAVCGGIAMAIQGSPRLTKDVDIIASERLALEKRIKSLVNRDKIRAFINKVFGANFQLSAKSVYQPWFDLADGIIERASDGLRDS